MLRPERSLFNKTAENCHFIVLKVGHELGTVMLAELRGLKVEE